jgi:tetratricopeptide (TPR) repeat protein
LLLVAACLACYAPALDGGFVSDDEKNVLHNSDLQSAGGLRTIWTAIPGPQGFYYPLTYTTYWIEHHLWGDRPLGYHLVNVFLHAFTALVLWRVLALLEIEGAWFGAAAFALHPVHAESVAWITERRNILSTIFLLTAVWSYFRPQKGVIGYVTTLVAFAAALLSKTVTLVLAPGLLLLVWWKKGRIDRADLLRVAPLFALALAAGLVTLHGETLLAREAGGALLHRELPERLALAGSLVWFYAGKLLWPAKLAFVYPRSTIDAAQAFSWLPACALVAILAGLFAARKRIGRAPFTALAWFSGTLLPVLGLASFFYLLYADAADRFLYVPSLGIVALAAGSVARAARSARARGTALAAGLVVLAVLGTLTFQRSRAFASPEALYADAIAKYPDAWGARSSLGLILMGQGRFAEAIPHLEAARRLQPGIPGASTYLAIAYAQVGRIQDALVLFDDALRRYPADLLARSNLGMTLARAGRDDEAAAELRHVLAADPAYARTRETLLSVLLRMIAARSRDGQLQEAVTLAHEARGLAEATGAHDLGAQLDAFIASGGRGPAR